MSALRDLVQEHLARRDLSHGGIMDKADPDLAAARISFVEIRVFHTEQELWGDHTVIQDRILDALDKYFATKDQT